MYFLIFLLSCLKLFHQKMAVETVGTFGATTNDVIRQPNLTKANPVIETFSRFCLLIPITPVIIL